MNTAIIIARGISESYTTPAANACWELNTGGKTDWFLPSKNELYTLVQIAGQYGFPNTGTFRSSSQYNRFYAWIQYITNNYYQTAVEKNNEWNFYAIRAF